MRRNIQERKAGFSTHLVLARWLLLGAAMVMATGMILPNVALAAEKRAECKVSVIVASREASPEGQKIPKNLGFLRDELSSDQFGAYKSFRLLETKSLQLKLAGEMVPTTMNSGHRLEMQLLPSEDKRLKIHAKLLSASQRKVLFDLDYRVGNHKFLLVAGGQHKEGKQILAIQCYWLAKK